MKLISRPPARRPACRVPVRHANVPDRQFGRTGCVWKHPFVYIASGAGVGPGTGFAGVCMCASGMVRLGWCGIRMQAEALKLLRMDVLTFETCWTLNNEIIKQVTSSWCIFIQRTIFCCNEWSSSFREYHLTHHCCWRRKFSIKVLCNIEYFQ